MINYLRALLTSRLETLDERGATAVEYGLLLAGIAVAIMFVVFTLGDKIKGLFTSTTTQLGSTTPAGS